MKRKDHATAILLNLFFPGAGYIYASRVFLGCAVMLVAAAGVFAIFAAPPEGRMPAQAWVGMLSVVGAVDGYLTVNKYNDRVDAE